ARQEVLGRGLAVGSGDAHDLQHPGRTHACDDGTCERSQSLDGIRDDDLRDGRVDDMLDEGEHGSAVDCGTGETVTVGLGTAFGDEDATGGHLPGVCVDDAADHGVRGVGVYDAQIAAGDGCD